jgi:outer membrane protein TolC
MKMGIAKVPPVLPVALIFLFLAGCAGTPTPEEKNARQDLATLSADYRPSGQRPVLPALQTNSSLGEYLQFAMLNQPTVAAAYYDWSASVEDITVERSLPDPKLTFQAYIQDALTSLMPGLMQDIPGPGKLKTAAKVASLESRSKYFTFETAVLKAAFSLKQAYYQLAFLDEKTDLDRQTLHLLADLEKFARTQNSVGKVTLQDVYRAQIEEAQLATEITNLDDSHRPLMAQFKAALGLTRNEPDPPAPARFESAPLDLSGDALLDTAFARNPRLKAMESDVRMAEGSIALARKAKVPDFSAGLQAEVYTPPFYWPQASMTLPLWRDKIAARSRPPRRVSRPRRRGSPRNKSG